MKEDEYQILLKGFSPVHPKRLAYLYKKWFKKGWYDGHNFTNEFNRIKTLVANRDEIIDQSDCFPAKVIFRHSKWNQPETIGILDYQGDNGWHLYTRGTIKHHSATSYFLGDYKLDDIAYIDPLPNPKKYWRTMNYLFWRKHKIADRFHQKVHFMNKGFHSELKEGDCLPCCQCKLLD